MAISETPLSTRTTQLTDIVLMVSPDSFGFNDQTASTNTFQSKLSPDSGEICHKAMTEFNTVVDLLRGNGIKVVVCPSRTGVNTPDAVFPNNWISFHSELDGIDVILYPMLALNRRAERQLDQVRRLVPWIATDSSHVLDLTYHEQSGRFLEGTGSLVFDRRRKVVFAHESARTSYQVLDDFCAKTGYRPIKFHAYGRGGESIYHTNVVMSIGAEFSVVCLDAIRNTQERHSVQGELETLGVEIIPITLNQLYSFCGNVLDMQSILGRNRIIMSTTAYDAFTENQKRQLLNHGDIVPVNIPTIETIGGGSARCLLAEIFPGKHN
ncbi:MAG: arginine deiminase-related protein [Candidatus Daviesbacteria bacterium]|nr:arginine deiminase-related protein [Candidatus Daviesbacteria bacterium]